MKRFLKTTKTMMIAGLLVSSPWMVQAADTASKAAVAEQQDYALAKKVRRELVTLPFYGVFDNFSFRIEDGTVTLMGQVTRPTLRSSAENVVKRLEGVTKVVNQIEVLPLSPYDDRVRLSVLRAVYGLPGLDRYGLGAQPSIRILVKNGEVTLEGIVATEMDRNIANLRANGVSGVFKVTNNLRVENTRKA